MVERNGLVWTYIGKRETPPGLPALEVLNLAEADRLTRVHQNAPIDVDWLAAYAERLQSALIPFDLLNRMPMAED